MRELYHAHAGAPEAWVVGNGSCWESPRGRMLSGNAVLMLAHILNMYRELHRLGS
jgi:hypothetical protein